MQSCRLVILGLSLCFVEALADDHEQWAKQMAENSKMLVEKHSAEVAQLRSQAFTACKNPSKCAAGKSSLLESLDVSQKLASLPTLLVFVSFGMPKNSLSELARSVQKIDGALVIRGLVENSFIKTAEKVKELGNGILLDPTLFDRYQIDVVPTFILRNADSDAGHDRLSGNVTLDFALAEFSSKGEVIAAKEMLEKLRGNQ